MDIAKNACVTIAEGKEKQLLRHHPWVFSGAIAKMEDMDVLQNGVGIVSVVTYKGAFIAYGWYDSRSHISLHLLSWDSGIVPDDSWWSRMVKESVRRRASFFQGGGRRTNALRLVHGEADFIPGFAIDVYGTTIRCIVSARIAWDHRAVVVDTLLKLLKPDLVLVSTDSAFCGIEQLSETTEWYGADGVLFNPQEVAPQRFRENGLVYGIVPGRGQKSGFFCDQRENRMRVAAYAEGEAVLDAFCYTGGFSLNALRGGAVSVDAVDASESALEQLQANLKMNTASERIPADSEEKVKVCKADVFEYLRAMEDGKYGLIVLDPPKLARTRNQVEAAEKAYKDINRLAIQKVKKGGVVATFSCSGSITRERFRTIIAWAAKDAGREVQILETLGQGMDHPVRLSFPESEYLKGFILRAI
jgi:23S rRNA (cytosine1962-C5)-methyltransferase